MLVATRLQRRFRAFYSCSSTWTGIIRIQQSRQLVSKCTLSFYANNLNNPTNSILSGILAALPFHWSISYENIRLFSTCESCKNEPMDKTLDQILSAIQNDESSSDKVVSTHISEYCKSRSYTGAIRLWQSLRSEHIILNPNFYEVLLVMAGEANNIDLMLQIFRDLLISSKSLRLSSYTSLSMAFLKIDDSALTLKFVKDLLNLSTSNGNGISINRLIYAFSESGQTRKALLLFNNMKGLKCKPDLITYNIVLTIFGNSGRVDEMLHQFAAMKDAGVLPDRVAYNTLLNCLKKMGRLETCFAMFKEMNEIGIEPDLRTYTALIEVYGRAGNIEESMKLFFDMKKRQIRPSIYIYRSLINNLMKIGKVSLAESYSEEMKSSLPNLVGPKDFKKKRK